MGRFATGVTVVTTRIGDETFGMTANAFMAGSLEPMLCVVSINQRAQMHGRLRQAGHYGVSFLSQEQQHLAAHFAGKPIEGLVPDFELAERTPILKRAVAAVTADVVNTAECGDHTLFIGRITGLIARRCPRAAPFLRRPLCPARLARTDRQSRAARVLVAGERCPGGIPVI